jgi:pimeloyl-ACP methyl ester carboxylesterase
LGEQKLNYFGVRWGTYLATVYTTLFPGRMDRIILDSMFNSIPVDMGYQNSLAQIRPFYERRDEWFDWIARYDGVFHLGTTRADARKAWDYVAAELRRAPAGEVGPSEFILTTLGAIVGEGQWIPMAQAISDFVNKHDDTRLRALATPPVSPDLANGYAATGVSCLDSAWPTKRATYEANYGDLQAEAPFIGWYMMWLTAHCSNWPAPSATRIRPDGRGLPPFLIVANRNDPGAVYEDVVKLHQIYSSSRLVTAGGSQISETFNPVAERNPYVDQIAADYLVSGILPVRDVTVPGHPLPDPTRAR